MDFKVRTSELEEVPEIVLKREPILVPKREPPPHRPATAIPVRYPTGIMYNATNSFTIPNPLPSPVIVAEDQEETFFWDALKGRLCIRQLTKNNELEIKELCNFQVADLKKIVTVSAEGTTVSYSYTLFNEKSKLHRTISEKKVHDFPKSYIELLPQFYVMPGVDALLKRYIAEIFEQLTDDEIYYTYHLSGWHEYNHSFKFFHSGLDNVISHINLRIDKIDDTGKFVNSFLNIFSKQEKAYALLLFATTAFTAVFFEEAAIPACNAVMQVFGHTGVGKSTVARILASAIYDKSYDYILRLDDTNASIEDNVASRLDEILLVDDRYLSGSKTEDDAMERAYNRLCRIAGDGRARKKMGKNGKPLSDRRYRGCIFTTAEFFDLNAFSSVLRSIAFPIEKGEVDFNQTKVLNSNPHWAKSFFSEFIFWLEAQQKIIIDFLRSSHNEFLAMYGDKLKGQEPRVIATATALALQARILEWFLKQHRLSLTFGTDPILYMFELNKRLKDSFKPENKFCEALQYCIEAGWLSLAENEAEFHAGYGQGFISADEVIISSTGIDLSLKRYNNLHNTSLKLDKALEALLVKANLLAPRRNSKERDKFTRNLPGKKERIHVLRFKKFINEV